MALQLKDVFRLPPRWVPGTCASFDGHSVCVCVSLSFWRILGELACATNAAMTGDGSRETEKLNRKMSTIDEWRH